MKRIILIVAAAIAMCSCSRQMLVAISSSHSSGKSSGSDSYVEAVRRGGKTPLVIPLVHSEAEARAALKPFKMLVLTGGEDVNPHWYGEEPIQKCGKPNDLRDTSDMLLIKVARERRMKILAICRGSQILNVALGGTLYQDIPSQYDSTLVHNQKISAAVPTQMVYLEHGSKLQQLVGADSVFVNSCHHQAVKDIAPGLTVVGRSSDGSVESYQGPRIIAVQFHPEAFVRNGDDTFLKVFQFDWK